MPSEVTDEQVERTALWCSLDIMAHDRRPIDDEAAAVLRRAAQVIKESVPIPVSERLPDWAIPVLVWVDTSAIPDVDPYWTHGCISRAGYFYEFGGDELEGPVTHWFPLPPPITAAQAHLPPLQPPTVSTEH